MFGYSGEGCGGLIVDHHGQRPALDRRGTSHRLDCRLRSTVGQAEGKPAEGRVGFERGADLLEEVAERGVADCRVTLLEVDLDIDRMLVVDAPEAAERLRGLARTAVPGG
jgi:hypothetical protein